MESSCEIRIDIWKRLLPSQDIKRLNLEKPPDIKNQHIISADIDRTRSHIFTSDDKDMLELCLSHYCTEESILYKQGLNELMAPFILMSRTNDVPIHIAYAYFKTFIQISLPTMFHDNELRPLQALFLIFRLLFRYHDPTLCAFLFMNGISPELYATSWLLTLYSCKINNIKTVYYLFEELILENDSLFSIYIGIAFLQKYKNHLLSTEDVLLPQTICGMSLDDQETLIEILANAREMKRNMPYSLHIKLSELNVFDLGTIEHTIQSLENEFCLSIDPREVLQRAYPEAKVCDCADRCEWCRDRDRVALLLLDVRTEAEQRAGAIPNSLPISDLAYSHQEVMLDFSDQFIDMRGVVHLCIIGTNKFLSKHFDLGKTIPVQEEDPVQSMVHDLLQAFIIKGFSYISVVDGGFFECHELAKEADLVIDDHDPKKCLACKKSRASEPLSRLRPRVSSRIGESKEQEGIPQSRSLNDPISLEKLKSDPTATTYTCKSYDKDLCKASSEEYVLVVTKNFIVIGEEEGKGKGKKSKILEQMKMENLSKIKSYNKDSKVLTLIFDGTKRLYCYMMNSQSDAKNFIRLAKKHYAALKGSF